jgi:hypothetical protein
VRRACRNKALQLLEKETALKRNAGGIPQSLSAPIRDDGARTELSDIISEDAIAFRTGGRSRPAAELLVLHIDVARATDRLLNEFPEAADLLAGDEPLAEVARKLGSRSTA